MNTKQSFLFGLTVVSALVVSAGSAHAAFLAGIDLDVPSSGVYYTEPGFLSVPAAGQDYNVTHNGITFDLDGTSSAMANRYRNQPSWPMETDFAQWYTRGGASDVVITVSGLIANTQYTLTIWSFNIGAGQSNHALYDGPDTSGTFLGNMQTSGNQNTPATWVRSFDFDVTSDGNGVIDVTTVNATTNLERVTINGIAISGDVVPEPASLAAGLLGLAMIAGRRRR